jgi:lipid-A-disaccharide synthase
MGFVEVARRFRFFRRMFYGLLDQVRRRRPAAVILVDYPGFNLRFARRVHELGVKTLYYICPQVWAWNRSRIPRMARSLDLLVTIFPFEGEHFRSTGLKVVFGGHPLVDESAAARAEPLRELPWRGAPKVALLPGSRRAEIRRILPVMWRAAGALQRRHPQTGFVVATPSAAVEASVRDCLMRNREGGPTRWAIVTGQTREVLRQADAGMIVSGTATIEAALMGCPMVVVYRTAWLTYAIAKALVKVKDIGMVNIIAGERVCPEFVQGDATPDRLTDAVGNLLTDGETRSRTLLRLADVRAALGEGHAPERAAEAMLATIGGTST